MRANNFFLPYTRLSHTIPALRNAIFERFTNSKAALNSDHFALAKRRLTFMSEPFLGMIIIVPYNFAPRGWAFCAGQILPIAQNTALFSLLGTTYGGNGQTTFALPDLRGRVPNSSGQGPGLSNYDLGQVGGTESTTLTNANLPAAPPIVVNASADPTSSKASNNFPANLSSGNGYAAAT